MLALSQILAIIIFTVMFVAIVSGRVHRYVPALIGGALVLIVFLVVMKSPHAVLSVLNMGQLGELSFWIPGEQHIESHGVNWQTVVFIGGMMVMVEGLGEVGFFRWLCFNLARMVNYRVIPILITFMLLSGFLSMFIDSITVLLFLAAVVIELARLLVTAVYFSPAFTVEIVVSIDSLDCITQAYHSVFCSLAHDVETE